jgi:restriction system protein
VVLLALWMVRAGKHGEQEQRAIEKGFVTIGWNELPSLSSVESKKELERLYRKTYPDAKKRTMANEVGQIWSFLKRMKEGVDLVGLPSKFQSTIAIGKVEGAYEYRTDLGDDIHHIRKVKWIKTDIPRTDFEQDLLYSFGAFMTVCRISRNNAEKRVRAILEGKKIEIETPETIDIEQVARDQILEFINHKFKGHDLARLVEAVIQAQGYVTKCSDPGPDGGVDILAGAEPMGFDRPRICIQVKSGSSPVDVTVLRSLQGTVQNFKADQGLLVSWSGFTRAALGESRQSFFTIRLWDSSALLNEILKNYDKLPETLQAELPLKKIWSIVFEE